MKMIDPETVASASRCLHRWYLDCHGDPGRRGAVPAASEEPARRRVQWLTDLVEPIWDGEDPEAGVRTTLQLMGKGHAYVFRGHLAREGMRGRPDLLRRAEGASALGDFTYLPVLIRDEGDRVEKRDVYELLCLAHLLEGALGARPGRGEVWLPRGRVAPVELSPSSADFDALLADMDRVRRGEVVTEGYRCGECARCPWAAHCSSVWEQLSHVCLLRGVTAESVPRFRDAGFSSWKAVAAAGPEKLAEHVGLAPEKARDVWLHARAWSTGRPQARARAEPPEDVPLHFYDIETYAGRTYLHGVVRLFKGGRSEKQFFAAHPGREREAWRAFLDYLAADERAVVYSWTDYERGFVRELWERYRGNPAGWRHLERNLIDQCRFVKDHFALPTASYSLKKVAPLFGFRWATPGATGLLAQAWYREWLETADEVVLSRLLRYNRDDVAAMEVIHRALLPESEALSPRP